MKFVFGKNYFDYLITKFQYRINKLLVAANLSFIYLIPTKDIIFLNNGSI